MLTGILNITSSIDIANAAIYNGDKILLLSEEQMNLCSTNNVVPATILLPPYPSIMAELDGDIEGAYNQYIGYLSTKEPTMFISAIIAALLNGTNMIILLGQNESEMKFVEWLYNYIAMTYGIMMGTNNRPFVYDQSFDSIILSQLYGYSLIGYEEFLIRYPYNVNLYPYVIPKLVMEINPYIDNPTEEAYTKYFEEYKNRIKNNNNSILINPLQRG